ncbi:MAG: hypothetical protein KC912_00675 [Proteobacteria bacterium]|nr:hypothetical protein [Pseudomonadota bacterium]
MAGLLFAAWWGTPRLLGVVSGERDLTGRVVYVPRYPVRPEAFEDIDLERVHAELLPVWQSRLARHGPEATSTKDALASLEAAVAPDPNLELLLDEMARLASRPGRDPERLLYLTWAWSAYLDQSSLPWVVQGSVRLDGDGGGIFYTKNYEVAADLAVPVGLHEVRARVVERVDQTNVVERYLGQASDPEDGALIVVDRVREVALDLVWPLLRDNDHPHAAAVQAEAFAALSPYAARRLVDTAEARARMVAAVRGIRSRHACGSRFVVPMLPWDGFEEGMQTRFFDYAEASTTSRCPTVTHPEAVAIQEASRRLKQEPELEAALEELVAWVARGVVVHEARHIADGLDGHLDNGAYLCAACEDGLSDWSRAEASAYVASLSEVGGSVELAEMCGMAAAPDRLPEHYRTAIAEILKRLGPESCSAPLPDRISKARRIEQTWFQRTSRITLQDFPERLPVSAREVDRLTSF